MDRTLIHACLVSVCLGLLAAGTACAAGASAEAPRLRLPDPMLSLRDMYPGLARTAPAAMRDFDARPGAAPPPGSEAPTMPGASSPLPQTTAWQRLGEARSPGGVRLLTLWHAASGTIALHAGKHGTPSLQWTRPFSAQGRSAQGLFDHLLAASGVAQH